MKDIKQLIALVLTVIPALSCASCVVTRPEEETPRPVLSGGDEPQEPSGDEKPVLSEYFINDVRTFVLRCVNDKNRIADVSALSDKDTFVLLLPYTYDLFSEDGHLRRYVFTDPNGNELGTTLEYEWNDTEIYSRIDEVSRRLCEENGFPWVEGKFIRTSQASANDLNDRCRRIFGRTIDCSKINFRQQDIGSGYDDYSYDASQDIILDVSVMQGGIGGSDTFWDAEFVSVNEETNTCTVKILLVTVDWSGDEPVEIPEDKGTVTVGLTPAGNSWTINGIVADNRTE